MIESKLHLGCGYHILPGYVNVDAAKLAGVEVVHDLRVFPWPFESGQFEEVIAVDVLEHLPDTIQTMEELFRVTKPGGLVHIRVPYYNAWDSSYDPTHVKSFNENSFDFFDPKIEVHSSRSYYASARFTIITLGFLIYPFRQTLLLVDDEKLDRFITLPPPYERPIVHSRFLKKFYVHAAHKFGNMIRALHVTMERLP